jgi:hypothetical protein
MELAADFSFQPLPPIEDPVALASAADPLGPLAGLAGKWSGRGFNVIWRPSHTPGQDRFLELNVTSEQLDFEKIPGKIPNRGLLQPDINMRGLTYLQQISDANLNAGLHIEPGLWISVPATSDPKEASTVARLASIPHGTTMLAQGTAGTSATPSIPDISIKPFPIGNPASRIDFPEQNPDHAQQFPDLRRRADRHHPANGRQPRQRPPLGDRGPAHSCHDQAACVHQPRPASGRRDREYGLPERRR